MEVFSKWMWVVLLLSCTAGGAVAGPAHDYGKALDLTFQFFEAQRSGPLPASQRADWRANSALDDGKAQGVDLVGGYYDAGDNVKFHFPMAWTITTLSWSVIEYSSQLKQQGQLQHALDAIKWGTDYFIKAHTAPNEFWAEVGDGESDHNCWQRPEDMTTSRKAYKIDASNPGTEVAAEAAAAMAAASIVFSSSDKEYSQTLLTHATQLFEFADRFRGKYDNSVTVVKKFYASMNGYNDELLWAALWMFEATGQQTYLAYVVRNTLELGGADASQEFSWDSKYAGVHVLASKIVMQGRAGAQADSLQAYKKQAEAFMCAAMNKNPSGSISRSPGGVFSVTLWNNMAFVTAASFLVTAYGDYMAQSKQSLACSGSTVEQAQLLDTAKSQMDYLLGSNPNKMSYMVGYGDKYPELVHHRGASIVSIKNDPAPVGCSEGYAWFHSAAANPNVIHGAVVGGPGKGQDDYVDKRDNFEGSEAPTYNSGTIVGVLARLTGSAGDSSSSSVMELSQSNSTSSTGKQSHTEVLGFNQDTYEVDDDSVDLKLELKQQLLKTWKAAGRRGSHYYKYSCTLTNNNEHAMEKVVLKFDKLRGPVFGLRKFKAKERSFTFPSAKKALQPGETLKFSYIFDEPQANITIKQALLAA